MRHLTAPDRRRASRGGAARGALVALGLVAAVVLQLAGQRLQGALIGADRPAPGSRPAEMAASAPMPLHSAKVAQVVAAAKCTRHPAS